MSRKKTIFDLSNSSRVRKIRKIFKNAYSGGDQEADVADILADLRHFCDRRKLDFAELDRRAYRHYVAEKNGTD